MCLSVIYNGKKKKEALAKLPDVVTGWAVVRRKGNKYYPYWSGDSLHAGKNKAQDIPCRRKRIEGYPAGFHRLLHRKDVLDYGLYHPEVTSIVIATCKIHKKDITAIGISNGWLGHKDYLCIVAKEITCPQYCGKAVKK